MAMLEPVEARDLLEEARSLLELVGAPAASGGGVSRGPVETDA